jgi:hypothetical protein
MNIVRIVLVLLPLALGACSRSDAAAAERSAAGRPGAAPSTAEGTSAGALTPPPRPAPSAGTADTHSGVLRFESDAGLRPAAEAERVLHVGDSMAPLVGNYLRSLYTQRGRNYWVETVVSSSTLDWAGKRLLQDAMYKYNPQVVVISLGSNELFDPNPKRRGAAVRQIVADTRGRPCLWIGPPLWKKDTGFVEVLKANLGHCRYFDSSKLDLPRMEDGRHPSWTGGYRWASAVWRVLGGTDAIPTGSKKEG